MLTDEEKKKFAELKAKEEENDEKEGSEKVTAGVDADQLVEKLVDKLADAIAAKKGGNEQDKSELARKVLAPDLKGNTSIKTIEYPSDLSNLTKDQKITIFFKAMVMRALDPYSADHDRVFKALVEGTDSEGGYLVPEELRAEVFRILPDTAVMRNIARVIPMASDTLLLNSLSARPVAYWTGEYASKTTSSAEFSQVTLNANDLVCLLPVTHQLVADANINIVQFILQLFAEAIAEAEDKAFFTGSGSGEPKGINQETLTTVAGGASYDGLVTMLYSLPQRVRSSRNAAWVANREVIASIMKLKDSDNQPIFKAGSGTPDTTQRLPDRLLGYPIYEQNNIEKSIFFGDWSYYIIGDRQQLTVETTTVGGEAWRRNSMEIKAVERVDGRAVLTSPFVEMTNA